MVDESVRRAMERWPDVPPTFGWLALNRRGQWLLEGDKRITHHRTVDFIGRNYLCDEDGRWYFQNGPQKVVVKLDYTPWVVRLQGDMAPGEPGSLVTHTGVEVSRLHSAWLDEEGSMLVETDAGIALVEDRDLPAMTGALVAADGQPLDDSTLPQALERFMAEPGAEPVFLRYGEPTIPLQMINRGEVAQRFGFVPDPQPTTRSR